MKCSRPGRELLLIVPRLSEGLKSVCEPHAYFFFARRVDHKQKDSSKIKTNGMSIFKFNDATLLLQKLQQLFSNIDHLLSLLLSGRYTLGITFYYFDTYIFHRYFNPHFEKPACVLFQQRRHLPLSLHLTQWLRTNQAASLIQLHFAQIKRNPE